MAGELTHDGVRELLGAFALDAVDAGERGLVESHLEGCAACREEVAGHLEVAAMMAGGSEPAPGHLWDRISASLEEAPPPLRWAPVVPMRARRRTGFGMATAALAAAVAAVALVGVMALGGALTRGGGDQLAAGEVPAEVARLAAAAARHPEARTVVMRSGDGRLAEEAVLLPDGSGFLRAGNLPDLPAGRTYQLWAVVGGEKISVGVLGPRIGPAAFRADPRLSALAITDEVAGGVVETRQAPTVAGVVA